MEKPLIRKNAHNSKGNPNWVKGKSANPAGRRPGTRDKWRAKVEEVLGKHFEKCGPDVLDELAKEHPVVYAKLMMEWYRVKLATATGIDPTREVVANIHTHYHNQPTATQDFIEKAIHGERVE